MKSLYKPTIFCAIAVLLQGCASIHEKVDVAVQKSADDVAQIAKASDPISTATPIVSKVKGSWVSLKKPMVELPKAEPLPAVFQTDYAYDYPGSVKVFEIVSALSRQKGIQVRFAPELLSKSGPSGSSSALGGSSSSLPALPSSLPQQQGSASSAAATPFPTAPGVSSTMSVEDIKFKGNVAGFFDLLASKMQVSWKYERGQVTLYKYDTRTYNIKALAGKGSSFSTVGASSGSSSSSSGTSGTSGSTSTQNRTNMTLESDLWTGIQQSVRIMLSDAGRNNFYASADLGTITITDEPERLEKVNKYLEDLNKDLGRQVTMHLAIYNVEIDESDTVGVDWSAIWGSGAGDLAASFGGMTSSTGTTLQNIGINVLKGPFANTKFILGALNKMGKTSLVTRGQIMTMNRQSAPLQVVDEVSYLAKTTTTTTTTSTSTSMEPGVVITGFSTTVTPKIEPDGDILLQFSGDISDLKSLDSYSSNGSSIQLPQKSVRDFLQRVRVRSGDTLVLTGFEQSVNRSKDQGIGSSKNVLAGQQFANGKRVSIVIVVTPYVMD
jgi:type IVB pilus formation R64 PilN family outer membrane protein